LKVKTPPPVSTAAQKFVAAQDTDHRLRLLPLESQGGAGDGCRPHPWG